MLTKINISKFYLLNFILFFSIGIFLGRIAGAPPAYLAMYGLSALLIYSHFHNYKICIPLVVKTLLIFFTIYLLYSLILSSHPVSTIKYYIMWLLNISVVYFILKLSNLNKFLNFYLYFIVFSSFLGILLHFGGIFYSSNPFDAFNKNSYIFLIVVAIAIALKYNKKYLLYIVLFSSIFIYSRTLYLMLIASLLFYFMSQIKIKTLLQLSFVFLVSTAVFLNLSENNFIIERIEGAFELVERLIEFFQYSDLSIGKGIDDHQRFYVIISNLDMLVNVFPFGTGMGLENYLSNINPKYSNYLVGGEFHRAHNYYLSYFAEMGLIFFIIFTFIIYKPLFLKVNIYYKALYFGMLVGIATNEYVTSPYFWILYALIYRDYYENRRNYNV